MTNSDPSTSDARGSSPPAPPYQPKGSSSSALRPSLSSRVYNLSFNGTPTRTSGSNYTAPGPNSGGHHPQDRNGAASPGPGSKQQAGAGSAMAMLHQMTLGQYGTASASDRASTPTKSSGEGPLYVRSSLGNGGSSGGGSGTTPSSPSAAAAGTSRLSSYRGARYSGTNNSGRASPGGSIDASAAAAAAQLPSPVAVAAMRASFSADASGTVAGAGPTSAALQRGEVGRSMSISASADSLPAQLAAAGGEAGAGAAVPGQYGPAAGVGVSGYSQLLLQRVSLSGKPPAPGGTGSGGPSRTGSMSQTTAGAAAAAAAAAVQGAAAAVPGLHAKLTISTLAVGGVGSSGGGSEASSPNGMQALQHLQGGVGTVGLPPRSPGGGLLMSAMRRSDSTGGRVPMMQAATGAQLQQQTQQALAQAAAASAAAAAAAGAAIGVLGGATAAGSPFAGAGPSASASRFAAAAGGAAGSPASAGAARRLAMQFEHIENADPNDPSTPRTQAAGPSFLSQAPQHQHLGVGGNNASPLRGANGPTAAMLIPHLAAGSDVSVASSGDSSPTLAAAAAVARARAERRSSTSVLGNLQSVLDQAASAGPGPSSLGPGGGAGPSRLHAGAGAAGVLDYIADVHLLRQSLDSASDQQVGAEGGASGSGIAALIVGSPGGISSPGPKAASGLRSRRTSLTQYGGTLTCLRPSIFASHFASPAVDSQNEIGGADGYYGYSSENNAVTPPISSSQHAMLRSGSLNQYGGGYLDDVDSVAGTATAHQAFQQLTLTQRQVSTIHEVDRDSAGGRPQQQQQQQQQQQHDAGAASFRVHAGPAAASTGGSGTIHASRTSSLGLSVAEASQQAVRQSSGATAAGVAGVPAAAAAAGAGAADAAQARASLDEELMHRFADPDGKASTSGTPAIAAAATAQSQQQQQQPIAAASRAAAAAAAATHTTSRPSASAPVVTSAAAATAAAGAAAESTSRPSTASISATHLVGAAADKAAVVAAPAASSTTAAATAATPAATAATTAVATPSKPQQQPQQQMQHSASQQQRQPRVSHDTGAAAAAAVVAPAAAAAASSNPAAASAAARLAARAMLGVEVDEAHSSSLPGYSVGKVIGEGGFCQVRIGVHHHSRRKVAIKIVDKSRLVDPNEAKRMQREIRVMRHLNHECVIKLFEVVDAPERLYLVMEHSPNGSLLDYVRGRKKMAEPDAAFVLQQIVAGLEYCHKKEVVHRDVKLENILLDTDNRMKLIDFGLSAFFTPGKTLRVHCGSPSYAAPEIVARKQYEGPPVDVWSMGVVLFAMLAGYLPFHTSSGNKQELCNKIMEGKYNAPESLSPAAKDLLQRMLTVDPSRRITFDQVWQHPWVRAGPRWEAIGSSIYHVRTDPTTGAVYADAQLLQELEEAGYSRSKLLQALLHGEANYLTAAYCLLAEAKAESIRNERLQRRSSKSRSNPGTPATAVRRSASIGPATRTGGGAERDGGRKAVVAASAASASSGHHGSVSRTSSSHHR